MALAWVQDAFFFGEGRSLRSVRLSVSCCAALVGMVWPEAV